MGKGEDAMDRVVMSTDQLAKAERIEASKADQDRGSASKRDALEEGRIHSRSEGDRGTGRRR